MRTIPFLAATLALAAGVACETRTQRNGDSVSVTVEAEPADEVRQFREATERRLDSLDARVAELRQRAAAQTAEAKAESERAANEVEEEARQLRARLRDWKWESRAKWNEFTADVDSAMFRLSRRIDERF